MTRDLLSIRDMTKDEINDLIEDTAEVKKKQYKKIPYTPLSGKTMAMIFHKVSTRTRVSFQVGLFQLGGLALDLSINNLQISKGETLADTAKVLSKYVDAILIRTYKHSFIEEISAYSSVPVINGLTDLLHPIQILSDLFTIKEKKGTIENIKVAYIGDGNNIANSWLNACAVMGFDLKISSPKGFEPNMSILEEATVDASENGGKISFSYDPKQAAVGADILYTDVWTSLGQESERENRKKYFLNYQINREFLTLAKKNALVMHCLPVHRGEEIATDVLEGEQSIVYDQAENRLHLQKAIMIKLILGD